MAIRFASLFATAAIAALALTACSAEEATLGDVRRNRLHR